MKRFRVKDLMIQALPEQPELQANNPGRCFWPTRDCWWTCGVATCGVATCGGATCGGATCGGATCGPRSSELPFVDWLTPVLPMEPEELAVLKGQLSDLLAQVELHEQRLSERDRPQTLDEITVLEEQLKAALEELQTRRNELSGEAKQ